MPFESLEEQVEETACSNTVLLSNESLSLRFQWKPDNTCHCEMDDIRTGLRLSAVLAEVETMWDALQRIDPAEVATVVSGEKVSDAKVIFTLRSGRSRIKWDLELELRGAELDIRIPWHSISEGRSSQMRLMGIRPLPRLMTTTDTLVVPLRGGGLVHVKEHAPASGRSLIYGEQHRWEELPMLPVCGMYRQGHYGLAMLVAEGDCDAQYEIELSGSGQGSGGFSFRYRYQWPDPVDPIDRTMCYRFFLPTESHYAGIGGWLRRFMIDRQHIRTLSEKSKDCPSLVQASRSLVVKTFHAMKELDREHGDGIYHVHQTFQEAGDQLRRLRDAGIEQAYVQLVGWNLDGHDGQYPVRFPVDDRLGGEADFRALVRQGQSLGYQMQVHDNYVDSIDPDHSATIRRGWRQPVSRGVWGGGAIYALNPRKMRREVIQREMERIRYLGVKGIFYLDAVSPPLEIDYDERNGGPRRDHAEGLALLVDIAKSVFGACGIECGFAHLARRADYVAHAWFRDVRPADIRVSPMLALVDEWIPLWHIAFHGIVLHALVDSPFPSLVKLLEAAETGALPRIDVTGPNPGSGPFFGVQWSDELLPVYKAKYDILAVLLGPNAMAFIVNHRCLGGRVYETTFSNRNVVRVDYDQGRLWYNDSEIEIPPLFDRSFDVRTG